MFCLETGVRRKTAASFMEPISGPYDWSKRADLESFVSCCQEEEQTVQDRLALRPHQEPDSWPVGSVTCRSGRFIMTDEQRGIRQELQFSNHVAATLFLRTLRASGMPSVLLGEAK